MLGNTSSSHWIRACAGLLGSFGWSQLVNLIDDIRYWQWRQIFFERSTRLSTWWRQSWVFLITDGTKHKPNVAFLACSLNLLVKSTNRWSRSGIVMVLQQYSSGVPDLIFSLYLNSTHERDRGNIGSSFFRHSACLFHPSSMKLPNTLTSWTLILVSSASPIARVMSIELSCSMALDIV